MEDWSGRSSRGAVAGASPRCAPQRWTVQRARRASRRPGVPSPAQCPCPVPLPRAPAPCPCPVPLPKPPPGVPGPCRRGWPTRCGRAPASCRSASPPAGWGGVLVVFRAVVVGCWGSQHTASQQRGVAQAVAAARAPTAAQQQRGLPGPGRPRCRARRLTFRRVLAKMTDWVMARVSYRSHRVSSFQSSRSWRVGGVKVKCQCGFSQCGSRSEAWQAWVCGAGLSDSEQLYSEGCRHRGALGRAQQGVTHSPR